MRTLLKGQSISVQYKGHEFDQIMLGLRQAAPVGPAALLAFTGVAKPQMQCAAKELAAKLGKALLRVDLQTVASKFIGETEKNLSQLFERAKASGAILLFDEADALFGQRTAVTDAHDRYANLETGYLLEKLENHRGIVIALFQSRIEAERRRPKLRQLVVEFPPC